MKIPESHHGRSGQILKVLLLVLTITLAGGCGHGPNDGNVKSKWVILNEGSEIDTRKVFFVDSLNGWATNGMGGTHAYFRSRDGGRNWELGIVPNKPHASLFFDLAFTDTLTGWLVGDELIYHTADGGESWTVDERFYDRPGWPLIKTVYFPDAVHGWIGLYAFGAQKIARTADGGGNWEIVSEHNKWLLQTLDGNTAFAEVYDTTAVSGIARTVDDGATWQLIYPGSGRSLSRVLTSFISQQDGWATVSWTNGEEDYGSYLIRTQDGGATWDTLLNFQGRDMRDIHMLPSREGWIITYPPQSFLYTTDGLTWREDPLPDIGDRLIGDLFVMPGPHAWAVVGKLILGREID